MKHIFIILMLATAMSINAQQRQGPLTVEVAADHQAYVLGDPMRLAVRLRNVGSESVWIYKELLWGLRGGLVLEITDASGRKVEPEQLDDDGVVPTTLTNASSFLELPPDYEWGVVRHDKTRNLFRKPGRYSIRVKYRSPVPRAYFKNGPSWAT
ncbi:MAG TPA: hypothetical protein VD837_09285, partial [Terriglobales bacterium]|nr:hypothetical protein [Terriglobales bacterium]